MYSIAEVLDTIDNNEWVWFFTACAWLAGFVQLSTGIWLTWKRQVIALPLGYVVIIFAHDSEMAIGYDHFFNDIDHWYFKMSWLGYPLCSVVELLCIVWFSRLAYREFRPPVPPRVWYAAMTLFVVSSVVVYNLLVDVLDDPLHIVGLIVAQVINVTFMIPLILRRGTANGTNLVLAWAIVGVASVGMMLPITILDELQTFWGYTLVVTMTCVALLYVALVRHFQREDARVTSPA